MSEDGTAARVVAGRYRLVRPVGRGGMGAVWAAHDELLDRQVAVKEVAAPPGLDAEERGRLRERTLREARAAARIRSGAAVTVYDVVEHEGQPYVVMELLPSRSLADVLREEGPLPAAAVAGIGVRLLEALSAAHAAAVLHRDVKPANVLFDARGEAVLTDFGIASLEGDPSTTTTGVIIGSPGFVAPERAHGRAPTPAADLWSLGVTLATAVHGRNPFERETPLATMMAAAQDPLPHQVAEGPLGTVLTGLLEKDPARRMGAEEARRLLAVMAADAVTDATTPLPVADTSAERSWADAEIPAGSAWSTAAPHAAVAEHTQVLRPVAAPGRVRGRRLVLLLVVLAVAAAGVVAVAALLDGPGAGAPDVASPTTSGGAASGSPSTAPASQRPAAATRETAAPGSDGARDDPSDVGDGRGAGRDQAENEDGGEEGIQDERDEQDEQLEQDEEEGERDRRGGDGSGGEAASLASGLVPYEDGSYSIGVPEGWTVERDGENRTRFSDPGSRRYLLVEEGGEPAGDPVEDWQQQEPSVAGRLDGYERIGIERADYRDFDAADWQFTWEPGGGPVRVLNRAVVDDDTDQAFALYWQVPVEEWEDSRALFDDVAASFAPAG